MFFPLYDDNPAHRPPILTYLIIAINVAVLVYMVLQPVDQRQALVFERGFIPARTKQLTTDRPMVIPFERLAVDQRTGHVVQVKQNYVVEPNRLAIVSTLFTCMFMHGGWLHLIGNMWFLKIFGNNIEDRLGHGFFLFFYLLGGLLATFGHWLQNPGSVVPVIGASGAVAAVLGAYAVTWPHARVRTLVFLFIFFTFWDLPALLVLGGWFVAQLLAARQDLLDGTGQGVAFMAHVAGFVAGAVLMPIFRRLIPPPPEMQATQPNDPYGYPT